MVGARQTSLVVVFLVVVFGLACSTDADVPAASTTPAPTSATTSGPPESQSPPTTAKPRPSDVPPAPGDRPVVATSSGDQTGNRVADGSIDLGAEPIEVDLGSTALWVVGAEVAGSVVWVTADGDGTVSAHAEAAGAISSFPLSEPVALPAEAPPTVQVSGDELIVVVPGRAGLPGDATAAPLGGIAVVGQATVVMAADGTVFVGDEPVAGVTALTDGRIVVSARGGVALLADPTTRLAHGVLGDAVEAETVVVIDPATASVAAVLDAPGETVFEAVSPMWADVDGDGAEEIVVTASDDRSGARLTVFDADGVLMAQSEPIGRGSRWLNQLAAAPLGPNGEIELVDIRTPHIGGVVRWYRLRGDRLELQAEASGFSTHAIGSRNLDLGLVADTDGDGRLDVVVPTQDRRTLVGLSRSRDGALVVAEAELGARLASNLSAVTRSDGTASLAAATDDGRLLIWP